MNEANLRYFKNNLHVRCEACVGVQFNVGYVINMAGRYAVETIHDIIVKILYKINSSNTIEHPRLETLLFKKKKKKILMLN